MNRQTQTAPGDAGSLSARVPVFLPVNQVRADHQLVAIGIGAMVCVF
jgi:hypothetical protein